MKKLIAFFFIVLVLYILAVELPLRAEGGDWYDLSWHYRKPITIDNTGNPNTLINYQVQISVIYDLDMQADFDDLRFTDSDGITLMDAWLESKIDSTSALIWVEVPSIPASSNKTIYMYYRNPNVGNIWNISDTMLFGDDFTSTVIRNYGTITTTQGQEYGIGTLNPPAIHVPDQNKVFIVYQSLNYDRQIVEYNTTTKIFSVPVTLGGTKLAGDHHGPPSLVLDGSGYIYVFYGSHDSIQYYKKSTNPYDISSWGSEQSIATSNGDTYPNGFYYNEKIYVFTRHYWDADLYEIGYTTYDGNEWADFVQLTNFGPDWPYHKIWLANGRIHIIWDWRKDGWAQNIYYIYSDDGGTTWRKVDGTDITASLPLTDAFCDADSVIRAYNTDGAYNRLDMSFHDVDSNNNPLIIANIGAMYKFLKWNGSAWTAPVNIANASNENSSAVLIADSDTNYRVYLVTYLSGKETGQLHLYTTTDGGTTWNFSKIISTGEVWRPSAVKDAPAELEILFGGGEQGENAVLAYGSDEVLITSGINGFDLNKWAKSRGCQWIDNQMVGDRGSLAADTEDYLFANADIMPINTAFRVRLKGIQNWYPSWGLSNGIVNLGHQIEADYMGFSYEDDNDFNACLCDHTAYYSRSVIGSADTDFHIDEFTWEDSTKKPLEGEINWYRDGIWKIDDATYRIPEQANELHPFIRGGFILDWVLVRNFSDPEPSAIFGAEEHSSTYYIGSGPTDDYPSWTAMQAVVQEAAGDIVSFRRGDTFREQITVPNFGTAGNPITYTAHGSGAKPIINGADLVTGWTEYSISITVYPAASADDCYAQTTTETIVHGTDWLIMANSYGDPEHIGIRFIGVTVPNAVTITTAYVRITANTDSSGTTCNITCDGENNATPATFSTYANFMGRGHTVASVAWNNLEAWVDGIQYDSPSIIDVIGEITSLVGWSSGNNLVLFFFDNSSSTNARRKAYSIEGNSGTKKAELHITYNIPNVWQATLSTESNQVFFDGIKGTKESAIANLDAEGEWYWEANVLYVYSTSDPDTAYVNPGIEAAQRDFCVTTNSKDYIVIGPGLLFKHANSANVLLNGANQTDLNYCISIDGVDGVEMDTAVSKVQNCVIYNCTNGIDVDAAGYVKNTIIRNCTDDLEETGASINKVTNSIEDDGAADPLMTDPASGDFTLQKTSPCRDAGTDVGLNEDYNGSLVPKGPAPDIGAYEYFQHVIMSGIVNPLFLFIKNSGRETKIADSMSIGYLFGSGLDK